MEQKLIGLLGSGSGSVYDRLPPLSANYPWFVAQNLEAEYEQQVQIFYNLHDPLSHYRCRIPQLLGRRIRGCFHGWVILSKYPNNVMWSLWNPVTSKFILLPPLVHTDIGDFCLSSPPDGPGSVLILTRLLNNSFVFCSLVRNRKRWRWTEMSYAKKVMNISGVDGGFIRSLTCCNGKMYAFVNAGSHHVVQVDILYKGNEVVISLLPFSELPWPSTNNYNKMLPYLKGSSSDLFTILICFKDDEMETVCEVELFKLDMTTMTWEDMEDLKDTTFSVELASEYSPLYSPAITSVLGGYIHIFTEKGEITYSYHVKDKTVFLSSMSFLVGTSHLSAWAMPGCRLEGDHADSKQEEGNKKNDIVVRSVKDVEVEISSSMDESRLLNLHFDVLKTVMKFCVGVEYLKFRATSKHCQLAAPMIQWNNKTGSKRMQKYSFVSPLLMVFDRPRGIITFTDPLFGDKYFINTPRELICDLQIYYSKYGWLMIYRELRTMVFFNPFTSDIIELLNIPYYESFCFSAPPTSPDCMVVGFTPTSFFEWNIYIRFVARESSWRKLYLNFEGADPYSFCFPTFYGRDLYVLRNNQGLDAFREFRKENYSWDTVIDEVPTPCCKSPGQYFLVKRDHNLLLIIMGKYGESIEVYKSDDDEKKWEKIECLGRHMIYICDKTCLCVEAKIPEMENKIYFQRLHSNGKIMFYSLETCRYHTFSDKNIQENIGDFFGMKHYYSPHVWIEPSWS